VDSGSPRVKRGLFTRLAAFGAHACRAHDGHLERDDGFVGSGLAGMVAVLVFALGNVLAFALERWWQQSRLAT